MKPKLVLGILTISFFIFTATSSAQDLLISTQSTRTSASIFMKNGDVKIGEVYGFIDRRGVSLAALSEFSSTDRKLNLTDEAFVYKNSDGESEKISATDVEKVLLTYDDGSKTTYLRIGIETVKSGKEKILNRQIWLPVIQEGAINVLGYRLYVDKGYAGTTFYFHKRGEENATRIIDYGVIDFNVISNSQKAMKSVFSDCPETLSYIDSQFEKDKMKTYSKKVNNELKENKKSTKKLPLKERRAALVDLKESLYMGYYLDVLAHYYDNCAK